MSPAVVAQRVDETAFEAQAASVGLRARSKRPEAAVRPDIDQAATHSAPVAGRGPIGAYGVGGVLLEIPAVGEGTYHIKLRCSR